MEKEYKPKQYNSLSPYLIVDFMVNLLKVVFRAKLRRFNENGTIAHISKI